MEAIGVSDGGPDDAANSGVDADDTGAPGTPWAAVDDAGSDDAGLGIGGGDGGVRASWSNSPAMMVSPGPGTFGDIRLLSGP